MSCVFSKSAGVSQITYPTLKLIYRPKCLPCDKPELLKVVSFVFAVPVSNFYTERVFSHMEDVWSDKRNRMSVGLVKAELQVRLNFKLSCLEFKAFIEGQHGLLKAAKGDAKYTRKNR